MVHSDGRVEIVLPMDHGLDNGVLDQIQQFTKLIAKICSFTFLTLFCSLSANLNFHPFLKASSRKRIIFLCVLPSLCLPIDSLSYEKEYHDHYSVQKPSACCTYKCLIISMAMRKPQSLCYFHF